MDMSLRKRYSEEHIIGFPWRGIAFTLWKNVIGVKFTWSHVFTFFRFAIHGCFLSLFVALVTDVIEIIKWKNSNGHRFIFLQLTTLPNGWSLSLSIKSIWRRSWIFSIRTSFIDLVSQEISSHIILKILIAI